MLMIAVIIQLAVSSHVNLNVFSQFPFPMSIPPMGWKEIDGKVLENLMQNQPWSRAAGQWVAYFGGYTTILIWTILVAVVYRNRRIQMLKNGSPPRPTVRRTVGNVSHFYAKGILVIGLPVVVLYCLMATWELEKSERWFQHQMSFVRNVDLYWEEVANAYEQATKEYDSSLMLENEQ
jgi:hypothetical protein